MPQTPGRVGFGSAFLGIRVKVLLLDADGFQGFARLGLGLDLGKHRLAVQPCKPVARSLVGLVPRRDGRRGSKDPT